MGDTFCVYALETFSFLLLAVLAPKMSLKLFTYSLLSGAWLSCLLKVSPITRIKISATATFTVLFWTSNSLSIWRRIVQELSLYEIALVFIALNPYGKITQNKIEWSESQMEQYCFEKLDYNFILKSLGSSN